MGLRSVEQSLVPRLKQCRVVSATLTGGEPFAHPELIEIVRMFRQADISVGICSNGVDITTAQMSILRGLGDVHVNVSLDGFSPESHGRFRGDENSFYATIRNAKFLAEFGLLQGFLSTPNCLAKPAEYGELCQFAVQSAAKYVLMNPLSSFGRGVRAKPALAASRTDMEEIKAVTSKYSTALDVVHIRFPNKSHPLSACQAGNIIYVFTNGEVTICPYLVFAAETPQSRYQRGDFIVGNVFDNDDIASRLDKYRFEERYTPGDNPTCRVCPMSSKCGKGCPAAVIAAGKCLGDLDEEVCPVSASQSVHQE
jgi:radical SAM protein with 4Fe4S-binding SPASM domain